MDIEQLATSAIIASISETDCLSALINSGDKEQSWDGFIYVYKDKSKKKKRLDGRVAVQVKGKSSNDLSSKTISFSAEIADLTNYLHGGGIIFFVVRIHNTDCSKRKIYYDTLTPVKLKRYLRNTEKQKTITISLTEFPDDKNKKASIVANFLNDSRKQASYVESGFISIDKIRQNDTQFNLSITAFGYGSNVPDTLYTTMLNSELYMYAKYKESTALIPVDTPVTIEYIWGNNKGKITIDDKCYYEDYETINSKEGNSIKIGTSVTLIFGKLGDTTVKTNICFSPYLRKAAKDMEFVIDAITAKRFMIGSVEFKLDDTTLNQADFVSATQNQLTLYRKIIDMLSTLNVSEDINLDELTAEEKKYLETLIKAFVDKKDITNINIKGSISTVNLKISNIVLKLIVEKKEDCVHTIEDFFNSKFTFFYKDENENCHFTSPYSALSKEDYLVVSNINYENILESYTKVVGQNPNIFERANNDLLQILLAYDEKPKIELLNAARSIAEWILKEWDDSNVNLNIKTLNYLQIIKRERPFTKVEAKQLCKISEDVNANESEKIGAYLLLDNQMLSEVHFDILNQEEQEMFRSFPIYRFWKCSGNSPDCMRFACTPK